MKKIVVAWLFCLLSINGYCQVTKIGRDSLIDVVTWNVEWFGDTDNGPSNETTQYNNIRNIIQQTDMDVWALEEVSNSTTFTSLLSELGIYDGLESAYLQTQKTAMIWKRSVFALLAFGNINDPSEPDYDDAFAGRPPLEVVLKVKGTNDTLYFYVIHLKANSGSADQASYNRRKNAVAYFKNFLDNNRSGKKVILLGDWNDDVDQSVVRINGNYLPTPFAALHNDSGRYFFTTHALSLAGETSYPGFNPPNMIDHIMNSKALSDSFYVKNSAAVLKQLATQVPGYVNNTSDHYPVYSAYNFKRYPKPVDTPETGFTDPEKNRITMSCLPNPTNGKISVSCADAIRQVTLFSARGELVSVFSPEDHTQYAEVFFPSHATNGIYVLQVITSSGGTAHQKIILSR